MQQVTAHLRKQTCHAHTDIATFTKSFGSCGENATKDEELFAFILIEFTFMKNSVTYYLVFQCTHKYRQGL